jgi:uncharacterized protein (DUF2147 family)
MKMSSFGTLAGLAIAIVGFGSVAHADPVGEWRVADGTATVKITKCGPNFCGFVATAVNPGQDIRNPDPTKRTRSTLGMQVFFNLKPGPGGTYTGETYNADDGQVYIATLTPNGSSMLIKGCVPGGGACGTETWTLAAK